MEYILNLLNFNKKEERFYYLSLLKEGDNKWSIHGLWPQYSLNNYPKYCKKIDFKIEKLNSIIEELKEKWYSNEETNEDFWKHEYEKHGSCMFCDLNELEYFKKTILLFDYVIKENLPNKYYNKNTKKCLIPFNLNFKLI
jgi:ribonuclease I